jgi:hypothetical protein
MWLFVSRGQSKPAQTHAHYRAHHSRQLYDGPPGIVGRLSLSLVRRHSPPILKFSRARLTLQY